MAEKTTTSSESKRFKNSPISTIKNDESFESKTMNTKEMAVTIPKASNNKREILTETNLHKLIQNKLKRKKKVTVSQSSFDDTSNKKRKTKLEVAQSNPTAETIKSCDNLRDPIGNNPIDENEKRVLTKPPLPPKSEKVLIAQISGAAAVKAPPATRLKRKLDENSNLVQKLNARAEQLRLEITDLKTALTTERSAVRTLRAQNEAETRKSKTEMKKLQTVLDASKKAVSPTGQKKSKEDGPSIKYHGNSDFGKLTQEITALKDANRALEEKIQIVSEAERRKTSDIRSQKDSYEIRLTQITKSAKTEINRLLEEIKTKERNIGQLKKEMHSLKSATNKKDIRNAQHPPEMKKLKEIERTENTDSSNQRCISTTCGVHEYHSMPHEITERILEAHDDLHIFRNKDTVNSDSDSALSSAPPSISPQPSDIESPDIWHSVKNYSKELSNLQNDNESLHRENMLLKKELESAKQQIEELEKSAIEARNSTKMQQLVERLNYLQRREDTLEKESHELREQNELLEFRILELEESNDKWSLRSNSTPDTRDMWTDTEKECDDLLMYPDRSDSGITSPHCQHHLDERNMISPYDLSMLDPISNDELRRRITAMTKRTSFDEYDKSCLLQILSLLNSLEMLSHDSVIGSDDSENMDAIKVKTSDYSSAASSPRSFLADTQSLAKSKSGKIVATISPYSGTLTSPHESPRKTKCWQTSSLQESGVFEGDLSDSYSQCTQTDPDDFPCPEGATAGDLCAEIQKLNKFREKIEECVTKSTTQTSVPAILSPNLSEQRKLQYYKDRLEILENKLVVYESSGDQQAKRLAERLQREVQLESLVKDFKQRIDLLESDNHRLEEERCEFEEAENDTRLRLQRLEVDLEILSQRNLELEMSKEAVQSKLQEARLQCTDKQDSIIKYQNRVTALENVEKDYKNNLNLIKTAMPAILLFNAFIVSGQCQAADRRTMTEQNIICQCHDSDDSSSEVRNKLHQLMTRERELTQNITELNRAYNETLESADNLWAQMEKDYKERLMKSKQTECLLKAKITKLEERLAADTQSAVERLSILEENESCYKNRICKMSKDNKELLLKSETLQNENQKMKHDYSELKNYVESFAQQNLEREKQKNRKLEEDVTVLNRMLKETEDGKDVEMQFLRSQLVKANKELLHIEVTNSELKEEVVTLETRICELIEQHRSDEDKIRNLADELRTTDDRISKQKRSASDAPNLAEELAPNKRINLDSVSDLSEAAEKLTEAIAFTESRTQIEKFYV